MTNKIETMDGYRRIAINRNQVTISISKARTDNKKNESVTMKKEYQIINGIDFGKHQVAQCINQGEITIFSITQCSKICKAPQSAVVKYSVVAGELFVKVIDDDKESLYDEAGNLIETDTNNKLEVVFVGSGAVLKKTNKKNGKESSYSFEGRLIG